MLLRLISTIYVEISLTKGEPMKFTEQLEERFGRNKPIFASEIVDLFKGEYSRATVYRLIAEAKQNKEIIQSLRGVYYLPTIRFWGGISTITPDSILEKKYMWNDKEVFGVIGGAAIVNFFSFTTQMAATIEIISNNEPMRRREIHIGRRRFRLRKSRCTITKDNYPSYMILQLMHDLEEDDRIDDYSRYTVTKFVNEHDVTQAKLLEVAPYFPARTVKRLLKSEVFNEIARR